MKRPINVTDEHLEYLDYLRDSGVTNMFGARPYLERKFGTDRRESMEILKYWSETFGQEKR